MYSLKFAKTYDFGIMERNNIEHVLEDKFYADDNVFCIADGVTRDFIDGTAMHYPESMDDVQEILEKYPNPSGAAKAAEICVNDVSKYLKDKLEKFDKLEDSNADSFYKKYFKEALEMANHDIKELNKGRKLNYTSEDSYCCTCVSGIIKNNNLYCCTIGDSAIMALDDNLNVVFDTNSNLPARPIKYRLVLKKLLPKKYGSWGPTDRVYYRKHVRNNRFLKLLRHNMVGVLNGRNSAMDFIFYHSIPLENVKYILAFSDGGRDTIDTKEKRVEVINDPESIKYSKCEKTLIIYEKKD